MSQLKTRKTPRELCADFEVYSLAPPPSAMRILEV